MVSIAHILKCMCKKKSFCATEKVKNLCEVKAKDTTLSTGLTTQVYVFFKRILYNV